jgi:hypothetical protein
MNTNVSEPLSVVLCKHTESDIFQFFFNLELCALLVGPDASGKNDTPTDVFQFFF